MRFRLRIRNAVPAAAVAALAVLATPAGAATVQLDAGATTLTLDKRAERILRAAGIAVAPVAPGRTTRRGLELPITGGRIDPTTAEGDVTHAGALQLRAGARRVRLTGIVVRSGKARRLSVKAAGRRVDAFSFALRKGTVRRRGFATTLADVPVKLTAAGAAALNRALKVTAFRAGARLARATVRSLPAQLAFDGGATTLALDPAFAAALRSAGVAAGPAGPAFANPDGTLAFPITGGKVNAKTLAGSIGHDGALVFSRAATTLALAKPTIYTSGLARATAGVGGARAEVFSLDVSKVVETSAGLDETLAGIVVKLKADGATALNQAFGTTFATGQVVGTATIAAHVA